MSSNSISSKMKKKEEPKNVFDEEFLASKDLALQPIDFFNESNINLEEPPIKQRHLSLKSKRLEKDKKSERSRKSQKSQKSQKSTSNTNKKSERRRSVSARDSQVYNSNIVIVHNDDENEDCSSTDPIEKEVAKLKKLISKNKEKKKKKNSRSSKSNFNDNIK